MQTDKFPPTPLPTRDLQKALKAARVPVWQIDLDKLAKYLRRSVEELEPFLIDVANAGYLERVSTRTSKSTTKGWQFGDLGIRLFNADFTPPITREKADRLLTEFLDRVRVANAAPDISVVAEVKLYGSLLDRDRDSFGDVDVDVQLLVLDPRMVPAAALPRLQSKEQALVKRLGKGLRKLSMSQGEVERLGCPFQVIYRFDRKRQMELPPDESVTVPTGEPTT